MQIRCMAVLGRTRTGVFLKLHGGRTPSKSFSTPNADPVGPSVEHNNEEENTHGKMGQAAKATGQGLSERHSG
jgi:hypothetical protein